MIATMPDALQKARAILDAHTLHDQDDANKAAQEANAVLAGLSKKEIQEFFNQYMRERGMSKFEKIARAAIARGESRVLPIEVGGKNPAIYWVNVPPPDNDIDTMTTEHWADRVESWVAGLAQRFPDLNVCVVAKPNEFCFIDCDTYREFVAGYEAFSGEKFLVTYTTSARENRVQIHFLQTDATRALGNVPQFAVDGVDLSFRQHNLYVLAEGSQHPTGSTYVRVGDCTEILPMPDKVVAYIRHLQSRVEKAAREGGSPDGVIRNTNGKIPHGSIHPYLVSIAGKMRDAGLNKDEIEEALLRRAHEDCEAPIDEAKVLQIAVSVSKYAPGAPPLVIGSNARGAAVGQQSAAPANEGDGPDILVENGITYAVIPHGNGFRRVALDTSEACARPTFPKWVMAGTSIYENLVKPAVEHSSKYAEFIFMPAVQAMMNYLSHKVMVELHQTPNLNLFIGLISPYGKFFKSSSCQLAHDYMRMTGLLTDSTRELKNSEGKVVIEQAGSAEGFMLSMQKLNAKCAVMFNDELGKLVSKAGIEGSSFSSDLLSWYGSAYVGNKVKNERQHVAFGAGSYTFGWLWCTTDRNFNTYWPKLAGISSGIQDRMFFLVSPEKPRELSPSYRDPDLSGAKHTRELIGRAVTQGKFKLDDPLFEQHVAGLDDPRSLDLVKKLALYFAVDLGLDVIDEDCVERARALVDYRNQTAAFLQPIEAENAEGRLMQEIRREIRQHGGIMSHRELCRNLHADRAGRTWDLAYRLLKDAGTQAIVEFYAGQTPGKRKTRMVAIRIDDDDLPE